MPDDKPVEIVETATVSVPMSGADMKKRIEELKKEKELKNQGDKK